MNSVFSRILKASCIVTVAGVLTACGSSSTVESFTPTRVIAFGDDYSVSSATVQVGSADNSVAAQLAAQFAGPPVVISCAAVGAKVGDIAAQIASGTAPHPECAGPFNEKTDLILITIGMNDVKDSTNTTDFSDSGLDFVTNVNNLLASHAKHVLIMPALEFSRTPWGRNNTTQKSTDQFNTAIQNALQTAYGNSSTGVNPWIYANVSNMAPSFLTATLNETYLTFTDTGYDATNQISKRPACNGATYLAGSNATFAGCDSSQASASYTTMLFADGIHLTPAGNLWMAQFLYTATAQGAWR